MAAGAASSGAGAVHRFTLSREDIAGYAEASGDRNPIHMDDAAARAAGLPGVVAHGMLSMGRVMSALIGCLPAGTRVTELRVRFLEPVAPGTGLLVMASPEERPDGILCGPVSLVTEDGTVALRGNFSSVGPRPAAGAAGTEDDEEAKA